MHRKITFGTLVRATALTALLVLGGTAGPAMAQAPNFNFGIHFGDEERDFVFGEDDDDDRFPERMLCLTNRQIRDAIAGRGYSDISLNVPRDDEIQVRATLDGWFYLLDYNFCSDRIEGRQRLRSAG